MKWNFRDNLLFNLNRAHNARSEKCSASHTSGSLRHLVSVIWSDGELDVNKMEINAGVVQLRKHLCVVLILNPQYQTCLL